MDNASAKIDEQGVVLGWTLIASIVLLQTAALFGGISRNQPLGVALIGVMFLEMCGIVIASYFYCDRSFLFRWVMHFIEGIPFARSRKWAFYLATLLFVMGAGSMLRALGIV